jgi:hypothetical protein
MREASSNIRSNACRIPWQRLLRLQLQRLSLPGRCLRCLVALSTAGPTHTRRWDMGRLRRVSRLMVRLMQRDMLGTTLVAAGLTTIAGCLGWTVMAGGIAAC